MINVNERMENREEITFDLHTQNETHRTLKMSKVKWPEFTINARTQAFSTNKNVQ